MFFFSAPKIENIGAVNYNYHALPCVPVRIYIKHHCRVSNSAKYTEVDHIRKKVVRFLRTKIGISNWKAKISVRVHLH
jgi:hypothetical protein